MRRPHRFRMSFIAVASTLAVTAAAPALAMHASGAADPWSLRTGSGEAFFSLGASVGYVQGTGSELVYEYPLGKKYKLSELKWDFDDVVLGGVQTSAGFGRYRLNLGYWAAIKDGTGLMVDRDWLYDYSVTDTLVPDENNWTHESRHPDTSLDGGGIFDVNLSVLALRSGPFSVRGVLGFKSDVWRWSARGGTYIYTYDEYRDSTGSFAPDEQVIEYKQEYRIPYIGLGANWSTPTFLVDTHVLMSPLVSATDTDYHDLRETLFEGKFFGGTYIGLGLTAAWTFAQRWSATMRAEYQSISGLTGDVTMTYPGGQWYFPEGGGVGMDAMMISLGTSCRF